MASLKRFSRRIASEMTLRSKPTMKTKPGASRWSLIASKTWKTLAGEQRSRSSTNTTSKRRAPVALAVRDPVAHRLVHEVAHLVARLRVGRDLLPDLLDQSAHAGDARDERAGHAQAAHQPLAAER